MKYLRLKPSSQKEIREILNSFGITNNEQVVYLGLLELGTSTVTPLARFVDLPTTTTASIAERLYVAGFATVTKRRSRHVYTATEPKEIKKIFEKRLNEIKEITPLLETLQASYTTEAKIRVYYRERMADIFNAAAKPKNKLVYEIVAARDFQEIIGEKLHFSRRRVEYGTRLKSLRVEAREIKKYSTDSNRRELREAKFLPRELTFKASFMWWDQTAAIFTTKSEGTAVVIESPVLTESLTQLFNLLWSVSRSMPAI